MGHRLQRSGLRTNSSLTPPRSRGALQLQRLQQPTAHLGSPAMVSQPLTTSGLLQASSHGPRSSACHLELLAPARTCPPAQATQSWAQLRPTRVLHPLQFAAWMRRPAASQLRRCLCSAAHQLSTAGAAARPRCRCRPGPHPSRMHPQRPTHIRNGLPARPRRRRWRCSRAPSRRRASALPLRSRQYSKGNPRSAGTPTHTDPSSLMAQRLPGLPRPCSLSMPCRRTPNRLRVGGPRRRRSIRGG